jgi:hypothetical protein
MSLRETHFRTAPPDPSAGPPTPIMIDLTSLGSADLALLVFAGCAIVASPAWVLLARRANAASRHGCGGEAGSPGGSWLAECADGDGGGGDGGGD